ncbi:MAG TPA: LLM class flavin-dependent oxidoreductase [Thermomicrobiales bacterium]|nr:LLM class flavin-dependent oxidoreductase [Thermomicrobiales bacterium]
MPYYGHPLISGTLIAAGGNTPHQAVQLAQQSESLGYDLVMLWDEAPEAGQSAPLDAWTTLTWIAGQTERVWLAALESQLHRRLPTIIGRQIASLDLLSHGRAELAFGPPASLDEVDALDEAIDIVRAILDIGEPGTVTVDGPHFPLVGAQRGPLPHHTIPIWLSGNALPLLELAGRTADGWIGSPDQLALANTVIDEAARDAGRDPTEISRIVIVEPETDLPPLALDHGAGIFLLSTNDPAAIERFAVEAIPALQNAVETARADLPPVIPMKPSRTRAKRRDGIDYDGVPSALQRTAVEPGDAAYARLRSNYMRGGSPGLILQPRTPTEVAEAIGYAHRHRELPLSVRSRGHGISGRSTNDGGLIIDLRRMNQIEILDEATRRIRVEPGARWMDVAIALAPYGWALSSGDYGGVGVGGLATAGGVGWLVREHGLTIDHLRRAQIVLADGSILHASENENPNLFWAIRGAGANMGVVTSFEFEVDPIGNVGWAQLVMDASDIADFLQIWGNWIEHAPRDITSFMIIGQQRGARQIYAHVLAVIDSPDPNVVISRLQPLADAAQLLQQRIAITTYAEVMANASDHYHQGQGDPAVRSGLLNHITPEFAASAEALIRGGGSYFFQIRSMGGAVADVPPDATAFPNRQANFSVVAFGPSRNRLDVFWDQLQPHFDGLYLSFETDTRPERLLEAFPEPAFSRLQALKATYDPTNLFRDNFNVGAAVTEPVISLGGVTG